MISPAEQDPRVKRTRQMLYAAFMELLAEKGFEAITVADITKRSTLHRATFYGHFTDKFALLEAKIGDDFQEMLDSRLANAGNCQEGIRQLILAVCDFFAQVSAGCQKHQRQFDPIMETRIKAMVRDFLLKGPLREQGANADTQLRATMASWAICGAAREWTREPQGTTEDLAKAMLPRVVFTLHGE
ncbi:MAG: TetR/AcrR family transcriptional regulator [Luteolibacter sp.]